MTTVMPLILVKLRLKFPDFIFKQGSSTPNNLMGTMCIQSKTLCPTLKDCKWGYLVFHRKRLEPRVFSWQQYSRCHSVSFVKYISGAKFEEHWVLCWWRHRFQIASFSPSTLEKSIVFKSLHSGERFWMAPFSLIVFGVVAWTIAVSGAKQFRFRLKTD